MELSFSSFFTAVMYYSNIREFTKADGAEIFYIITILEELSKVVFVHLFLLSLRGISGGLAIAIPN
jgi:hypothetical protein